MKKRPIALFYIYLALSIIVMSATMFFLHRLIQTILEIDALGALVIVLPSSLLSLQALIAGNKVSYYTNWSPNSPRLERFRGFTTRKVLIKAFVVVSLSIFFPGYGVLLVELDSVALGITMIMVGAGISFFLISGLEFLFYRLMGDV